MNGQLPLSLLPPTHCRISKSYEACAARLSLADLPISSKSFSSLLYTKRSELSIPGSKHLGEFGPRTGKLNMPGQSVSRVLDFTFSGFSVVIHFSLTLVLLSLSLFSLSLTVTLSSSDFPGCSVSSHISWCAVACLFECSMPQCKPIRKW